MSYTQRNEEEHIVRACAGCELKRFLDIGAWHAKQLSNTRALYDLGWTGVLAEPSPGPVRGLVQEYGEQSGMAVICAAVALEPGLIPLQITDDAVSSAGDISNWKSAGGYFGTMWIQSITIPQILNQWGAFSMVSIDTEGTSTDLLRALLETDMLPACIVVEHDGRIIEATKMAEVKHYRVATITEENIVFARGGG